MSQAKIEALLKEKKFRQAIDEIKILQRSQPDVKLSIDESTVWAYWGHNELLSDDFKAAENSFRQALKLGCVDQGYYGVAKALLRQNRSDAALDLIRDAFDSQKLPKDSAICYLKLLLIKGDRDTVETLIKTQPKRFSAAQLHWVRGILALQSNDAKAALTSFQKIKKPLTWGDSPDAWMAYTYQQQENWDDAAKKLGLFPYGDFRLSAQPDFVSHRALSKLITYQYAVFNRRNSPIVKNDQAATEILNALGIIQLISEGNLHDAGHAILELSASSRVKDLVALRPQILKIAGQQAMQQQDTSSVLALWPPLVTGKLFDVDIAVNLLIVLEHEEEYQEKHRLLIRLIKWIEDEAKRDRTQWSDDLRKLILAHAHCLVADCLMDLDRVRAAIGAVQQAERLCPTSPEVIGRKGFILNGDGEFDKAIDQFKQALDMGCQSPDVYLALQECLEENGRKSEVLEIRKRYGKNFGDLDIEDSVEMDEWIEALSTRNYEFFSALIPPAKSANPPLRACQIFKEFAHGNLTGTGKISIHQDKAIAAWGKLLGTLDPATQVTTLQAIALCIEILAKRDKGIAALITSYMLKITDLKSQVPAATVAHLIVLATREKTSARLQVPIMLYLNAQPSPSNALALLQLQVRWFNSGSSLQAFIEKALLQEPQNPLLLLAKATTYGSKTRSYSQLRDQSFELARQLQDAQALQALRIEDYYVNTQDVQNAIPNPGNLSNLGDLGPEEFDRFFENMIRQTFGKKVPKAELDRMMPILKQKFFDDMMEPDSIPFGGNPFMDDDDENIFGRKKSKKKNPLF